MHISKIFQARRVRSKGARRRLGRFHRRRFVALMGPSGSGKTSLLNMIAAIDRPTSGQMTVMGEDIFAVQRSAGRAVAQPHNRLRLPDVQPHPGADGV